ncbi:GNAT family N-acetyltransferase [Saccharothrix sp. BKS2]|uniref:GNAT family N-acetyltransferase n=1 Tax=Saccharothrix sp. BKS2 TaxID=3064400 RepID=UPI0039EB4A3A
MADKPGEDVGVLVHRLTAGDRGLLDVAVRTFRGIVVEDHAPFLEDPATVAFVALEGGEVVGWVWGCRQRHVGGYSQVQLYEIGVVESVRRRGIGRALLTTFRDHAIGEGHRKMWLFTDEDNHAAKALYEAAGGQPSPHADAGYWWLLDSTGGR